MTLLAGPPYNLSPERIGRLNRQQIQTLYLRHRNKEGLLDIEAVMAERRAKRAGEQPEVKPFADLVRIRRMQGWPEYLIDSMVRDLTARSNGGG